MQQLFLGFEVVQQASRADAGLTRDQAQAGTPAAIPRQEALGGKKYALPPVFALGEEGGVSSLITHHGPFNQPTERTLDWLPPSWQGKWVTN
jgi:hypothetical protein